MASVLCMISCAEHDADIAPSSDDMVQVQFNVQTLDVDNEPMHAGKRAALHAPGTRAAETDATPLTDKANKIQYIIINTETGKSYEGTQTASDAGNDFGTIKVWIPGGTYKVFFAAFNESGDCTGILHYPISSDRKIVPKIKANCDAFSYMNTSMKITTETNSVDVALNRCVGKVTLRLTDNFPDEIKRVHVYWLQSTEFQMETGKITDHEHVNADLVVKNGVVDELSYFAMPDDYDMKLTMYDADDAEIGETHVNFQIIKNRRTIIHGNLLDVIKQKPFTITISDDWGTDVDVPLK